MASLRAPPTDIEPEEEIESGEAETQVVAAETDVAATETTAAAAQTEVAGAPAPAEMIGIDGRSPAVSTAVRREAVASPPPSESSDDARLDPYETSENDASKAAQTAMPTAEPGAGPPVQDAIALTVGADDLFAHLLERHERISYGTAFQALIGVSGRPWRGLADVPVVLRAARSAEPRSIDGTDIGLEALIVNKKTRRLTPAHFKDRAYGEDWWVTRFASWPLCGHTVDEIGAGSRLSPVAPVPAAQPEEHDGGDGTTETSGTSRTGAAQSAVVEAEAVVALDHVEEKAAAAGHWTATTTPAPAPGMARVAVPVGVLLLVAAVVVGSVLLGTKPTQAPIAGSQAGPEGTVAGTQEVRETFDSLPVGTAPGWTTTGAQQDAVGVFPWPTSIDRSVRLRTGEDGRSVTACRGISPAASGALVVDARIFVDALPGGDAALMWLRSGGERVATVHLGPHGELAAGGSSAVVGAALAAGAWFDVRLDVDLVSHTYRATASASGSTAPIFDQSASWVAQVGSGVDGMCFSSPDGSGGGSLYINELHLAAR